MTEANLVPEQISPLLLELARACRARQFYPPSHPALREVLDRSTAVWREGMSQLDDLELELRSGSFVLPSGAALNGPGIDELAKELRLRGVRRLRVHPDLEAAELLALVEALAVRPQNGDGSVEQALVKAGVRHITTTEADFAELSKRMMQAGVRPITTPEADFAEPSERMVEAAVPHITTPEADFAEPSERTVKAGVPPITTPEADFAKPSERMVKAAVPHITTPEADFAKPSERSQEPEPTADSLKLMAAHEFLEDAKDATESVEEPPLGPTDEPVADDDLDTLRADSISHLTRLLARVEQCEELHEYEQIANQVADQVARITQAKHVADAYRALLVFCRHAGSDAGRPAPIRREAEMRLGALMEEPALLDLVTKYACRGDGLASVQATQILTAVGPNVVPALLTHFRRTSPKEQAQLTAILIAMGESAFPALVDQLGSSDSQEVRQATWLIGRMQNPRGVEHLLNLLQESNADVFRELIRAVARIGNPPAVKGLVDVARKNSELAELVAACLGDTRSEAAVQALIGMMDHKSSYPGRVKREAIRSIGRIGNSSALGALEQILTRRTPLFFRAARTRALRVAAAQAIGRIGGPQASALLNAYARRGDRAVAKACRQSLDRLARVELP